jgi:hypothetical protein
MSKAIVSTVDTIEAFKGIAYAHNTGLTCLDVIKGHIETLRKGNVKFGKSKATCPLRIQALDAYKAAFPKTSVKTLANYVTSVVAAVNDGAEFSFSSSKGKAAPGKNGGKGKGSGKATEQTSEEKMIGALLNVWKLSAVGESVLIDIETNMATGMTLIDAISDVLVKGGQELEGVATE